MEKMMMPSYYNVMTEEEMTYTYGGDQYDDAAVAIVLAMYGGVAIAGLALLANYVWGVATARNWISANRKDGDKQRDVGELFSKALNDLSAYMGKSIGNAIVGGFTTWNVATQAELWPITLIAFVTA